MSEDTLKNLSRDVLTELEKAGHKPIMSAITCYRIVEVAPNGDYKTLFHGLPQLTAAVFRRRWGTSDEPVGPEKIIRSRVLPVGAWLVAELKTVSYGRKSKPMLSGFNVFLNREDAEKYLTRFTGKRTLKIVTCVGQCLWPKPGASADVWLAQFLKIIPENAA